jgi:hypothetical protein
MGGQRHPPAALPPGKETRYPLYRRLGGPQGWSGRVRKISLPTGIRSSDLPSRSESLYRLSYPGPPKIDVHKPISYRLCFMITENGLIVFKDQLANAVHAICVYLDGHLSSNSPCEKQKAPCLCIVTFVPLRDGYRRFL